MTDLTRAMAAADQPVAIFEAIHQTVNDVVGVTLFTIMRLNREKGVAERIFSSCEFSMFSAGPEKSREAELAAGTWKFELPTPRRSF